jgi:ribulose-phosphate 3-epimerase
MAGFSPSLFAGRLLDVGGSIGLAEKARADFLHMDIMDGHFAEDFGFGVKTVREARACSAIPIDIHLMVNDPEKFIDRFAAEGVNCLFFHTEAAKDNIGSLKRIKRFGVSAGIAISPETEPQTIGDYIPYCDEVLVMTVKPGCGGAAPDEKCIRKIKVLAEMAKGMGKALVISADGGIDLRLAGLCAANGADKIVIGTAFYRSPDPAAFGRQIRDL